MISWSHSELLARIGPGAAVTTDTAWTAERAEKLLCQINPHSVKLIEAAVAGEGFADGAAFRAAYGGNSLKGPLPIPDRAVSVAGDRIGGC